jgi:hypothetical protein
MFSEQDSPYTKEQQEQQSQIDNILNYTKAALVARRAMPTGNRHKIEVLKKRFRDKKLRYNR